TRFSRDWSSDVCSSDLKFRKKHLKLELRILGALYVSYLQNPRRRPGDPALRSLRVSGTLSGVSYTPIYLDDSHKKISVSPRLCGEKIPRRRPGDPSTKRSASRTPPSLRTQQAPACRTLRR